MLIQWYPGHMTKTKRLIEDNIKLVDIVIELLDARAPHSTKNPDIDKLAGHKPRVIVLNKADLADPDITQQWIKWYSSTNVKVIPVISTSGKGIKDVAKLAEEMLQEKIDRDRARGRIYRPIRAMIVGIPNVGKSTFINSLVGKGSTKTGDKPGVTRGKQWVKIKKGFELLDMPGILWPKFEDQVVAMRLAYLGSIKDDILDVRELAINFLSHGQMYFSPKIEERYKIEIQADMQPYEIFEAIAKKRGFIAAKGAIDEYRTSNILFDEFRAGKIGHITLESPAMVQEAKEKAEREAKEKADAEKAARAKSRAEREAREAAKLAEEEEKIKSYQINK
ncbi:MAG: ribosome biogenesis GTPase YlqF [Cellulosilyticaceae bacterium]